MNSNKHIYIHSIEIKPLSRQITSNMFPSVKEQVKRISVLGIKYYLTHHIFLAREH